MIPYKLVLFDIDGTLVSLPEKAAEVVQDAMYSVLGTSYTLPYRSFSGRTDWEIFRDTVSHYGENPENHPGWTVFCNVYSDYFMQSVNSNHLVVHPGGLELLETLENDGNFLLGLLTGNIREMATFKLSLAGLADFFEFGAFGDDHWIREQLGPIAKKRAEMISGEIFTGSEIWVVGDSPRDVQTARFIEAKCIGVTNGKHSTGDLLQAGADIITGHLLEIAPVLLNSR